MFYIARVDAVLGIDPVALESLEEVRVGEPVEGVEVLDEVVHAEGPAAELHAQLPPGERAGVLGQFLVLFTRFSSRALLPSASRFARLESGSRLPSASRLERNHTLTR